MSMVPVNNPFGSSSSFDSSVIRSDELNNLFTPSVPSDLLNFLPSTPSLPNFNSASGEGDSDVKDDTMSYWLGLLASVGQQNELNRIFNKEQANLTREFNSLEAEKSRQFNSDEAKISREFNASEAEKSRQWSEKMSNTSYQRAVLDLQKAGLNPILAYQQGGASSPASASASGSAASGSAASGQNASYNVGGGDTLSGLLKNFGSLISSVGSLFKKLFGG